MQTVTIHGTDTVGFLGQAPRRSQFRLFGVNFCDVDDGQILRERRLYDVNGLMLQLATSGGVVGEAAHLYRTMLVRARMEQDLKIAGEIQRALMPRAHHTGLGFEIAAASLVS